LFLPFAALASERINHAGRILGPMPVVTNAILFNTNLADAVVSALQIFPPDNPWNEDVSARPLLANSTAMISQISSELATNRQTLRPFQEMNFVLVPDSQPLMPIDFVDYPDESDPSPYPIPSNLPIETWPAGVPGTSLSQWQEDTNNVGGDRHAIIVQPGTGYIYETWQTKRAGTNWQASNGARFNLNSNGLRKAGDTSGDAAGLPMFPAIVRYDECARGTIEHALRIVVKHTRAEYIYPARHFASSPYTTNQNIPAMGQRLRLKAGFVVPSSWNQTEKAICAALKKYGGLVADNGNFFSISVAPDDRFGSNPFPHLGSSGILSITNFEVIQTTGPSEGPRSPGAPSVNAGADINCGAGQTVTLAGTVQYTNTLLLTVQWRLYSGPTNALFANGNQANTTVSFPQPGTYTLMLSADDGVHTVAYDATVVTVSNAILARVQPAGQSISLSWSGGTGPFDVFASASLQSNSWTLLTNTSNTNLLLPRTTGWTFYRVRGR